MKQTLVALGCIGLLCLMIYPAYGRSAMSPRHSGLEPPGGPRNSEVLPGAAAVRTPEGGMGYVDAYGNTLTDIQPEERKKHHRPRAGAYGGPPRLEDNHLPDPGSTGSRPVWSFH